MKEKNLIDVRALAREAEESEHMESYTVLEKNQNYRIGAGARLTPSYQSSFFIEILIRLCPNHSEVDLSVLEKSLLCLKQLQAREYSLSCQDENAVSCEINVTAQSLAREYETIRSIIKRVFQK